MRILLSFYFLIYITHTFAQKGFYLRPFVEKTISYNKIPFQLKLYNADGLPITLQNTNLIRTNGLPLGIYLGYKFNRLSLEAGITRNSPASGATISGFNYDSTQTQYTSTYNKFYGGVAFTKVPLRLNYRVIKRDSIKNSKFSISVDLNFGLDLMFSPKGDPNKPMTSGVHNFYSKNGEHIQIIEDLYNTQNNFSYLPTLGFTFKIQKKKTNILNFTFLYSKGIDPLSEERISVTQTGKPGITHSEYSNGSGFYISVSREFYLSNFLERKKQRTAEKYERFKKND